MPLFMLNEDVAFPPVDLAEESGILAIGGDLSTERLIKAYSNGIFPWYSDGDPIIWWSPNPRFVLFPEEIKISRSMRKVLKRKIFHITYDRDFTRVISECQKPRDHEPGTWITDEMLEAYIRLHEAGYAHSVEAWKEGKIAGGLYGVSLGRCFFGESMFTRESDASKSALITMAKKLESLGFRIIDCQVFTQHLKNLGARYIPRQDFMTIIQRGIETETMTGNWGKRTEFQEEPFIPGVTE